MIFEYLKIAWKHISRQQIRSMLTIIGIIIGVASVVALISISSGMQKSVERQFENFGADKIMVIAGKQGNTMMTTTGSSLTEEDVKVIKRLPEVEDAYGMAFTVATVSYRDKTTTSYVTGIDAKYIKKILIEMQGYSLESGHLFSSSDKYKAILGWYLAHKMFDTDIKPGSTVFINGKKFKVVGIMNQVGNRMDDNSITIPLTSYYEVLKMPKGYQTILVDVKDNEDIESVAEKIEKKLKAHRGEEDFTVMTSKELMKKISSILSIIQVVFIGIAAVSLIVGSVGIMNTMYMSVVEKTREIGVMKAVGATPFQIMAIFLIESAIVGGIGGLIGAILGGGLAIIIQKIAISQGISLFRADLSPHLFIASIIFAMIIGIISGVLPAKRAAKLEVVSALRYE